MLGIGRNAGRLAAAFAAAAALALSAGTGCGGGEDDENRGPAGGPGQDVRGLQATVDPGSPVLAPFEGYVGSVHCIGCHATLYATYEKTSHARGLRTAGRPGVSGKAVAADSDRDGRDDFREGLDLATAPAFAGFGASAPRLSYARGAERPYGVTIGGVAYEVVQVYGGARREDYLLRVGRSLYAAPMEWDVSAREWVLLEADTWYAGTTPRFASAPAAEAGIDRSASFERRCAGCHGGGFQVRYDAPSGEWLTGYTETGIGCESCHGPGRDHVASGGDPARIVNPRALVEAGQPRLAEDVCARCHTRGEGATLAGSPAPVLYPWSGALDRPFLPGDEARNFVTPTADPADYWGRKDNFLAPVPTPGDPSDDSFVAARSGWMQGIEQDAGAHAASVPATARCFDCHAAHGSGNPSQIVEQSTAAPQVGTSAADGSLCLACHAGTAPFEGIGADDVARYAKGKSSGVPASVVDHMKDVGMPVAPASFQPAKTGVGSCTACHMVSTATERRAGGTDPGGHARGGPGGGTHGALALWPSTSERNGVTSSCSACHPEDGDDPVGPVLRQWAAVDADGDGRFHGYTPRGEMLGDLNAASGEGLRCARCHTTRGFREIVVGQDASGLSTDDERLGRIVARAARLDEGITCAACHGKDGNGNFGGGANPLRLPAKDLCASCHFDAGIDFEDYTLRATSLHFPQKELLAGTAGEPPPGTGFYPDANHAFFADGCVKCHYDTGTDGVSPRHDFQPLVETCQVCHPAAATVNIPSSADYDGDGVVEGIQDEVEGLLAILKTAILTGDAAVTFDPTGWTGFERYGVPGLPGATVARQRAAYNWEVVSKDGSRGVHNAPRAVKLLQQSYRELTGSSVPGAVLIP